MADRLDLHEMLCTILGTRFVYFQPPASVKMHYPAIRYSRKNIENDFANNGVYHQDHFYELIVIDEDPDSIIVDRISKIPSCRFDRHYTSDNLNHDVFTLYF